MGGCFSSTGAAASPSTSSSHALLNAGHESRVTSPSSVPRQTARLSFSGDLKLYTSEEAILALLRAPAEGALAPVRLLDGQWLLRRAEQCAAAGDPSTLALPRRQDLELGEPSAYMDPERLAELERGDAFINSPLSLVCVSYAWLTRDHPDPRGEYLVMLAEALKERVRTRRLPEVFAVFFDWCSLCQKDATGSRSSAEKRAFDTALSCMQVWYASQKTLVYILSKLPTGWEGNTIPYQERGWPTFERAVSVLIKMRSEFAWISVVDVGNSEAGESPPLTPEAFDRLLQTKTFTNGADQKVVSDLYRETMATAFGQVKMLRYTGGDGIDWEDPEAEQLAQVLPLATGVIGIALKWNFKMTAVAGDSLARVIEAGAMPKLKLLGVTDVVQSSRKLKSACEKRGITLSGEAESYMIEKFISAERVHGEVIKDGMMEKYSTSMFAGWQKMRFQLHKTGLAYFTDPQGHANMIGIESIKDIQLVDGALHLTCEDAGKPAVHKLRAGTADETEAWELAILDAWGYSSTE